jgi:hypothetical protein
VPGISIVSFPIGNAPQPPYLQQLRGIEEQADRKRRCQVKDFLFPMLLLEGL